MNFLRPLIQRKLSELLGTPVEMDQLDAAPLKGEALARNVRIAGDDPVHPLLRIDAIRFAISLMGMFQKRVIVKSLTIDRPVVNLRRTLDGRWNLPPRTVEEKADPSEEASAWQFDAEKILLIDGQVLLSIELESGWYDLALDGLAGQTERGARELRFTFLGRSLRAGGRPVTTGEVKLAGTLTDFDDLRQILASGLTATLELEPILRLIAQVPRLESRQMNLVLDSAVDIAELIALLPPQPVLAPLGKLNLRGPLRLSTDLSIG